MISGENFLMSTNLAIFIILSNMFFIYIILKDISDYIDTKRKERIRLSNLLSENIQVSLTYDEYEMLMLLSKLDKLDYKDYIRKALKEEIKNYGA